MMKLSFSKNFSLWDLDASASGSRGYFAEISGATPLTHPQCNCTVVKILLGGG
jgi:hypothetical protein